MAQCRCNAITLLDNDKKLLEDISAELSNNIDRIDSIVTYVDTAVSLEENAYDSSTHETVMETMRKSDDELEISVKDILSNIDGAITSLSEEMSILQTEDDEYHAEEEFKKKCAEIEERERQRLGYN